MAYMPYTTNPHLPRVRGEAVKLVRLGWSIRKTARHLGFEPSTVMRWVRKGTDLRQNNIQTESSRPHHHPHELSNDIVTAILRCRKKHRRCSEVIHHLLKQDGVNVSLSSVKRTLKRHGLLKSRSPWQKTCKSPHRPEVAQAGDLVEMDTIHIHAITGQRFYVYTLLDVHSRWAFAEVTERINTRRSLAFLKKARAAAPFSFKMLQSDHGSEFSKSFRQRAGAHRHSRIRRPNDNGHLERFNRTLQEEGLRDLPEDFRTYRSAVRRFIPFYNDHRPHLALNFLSPNQVLRSY
jgi:transposase InsO family protein